MPEMAAADLGSGTIPGGDLFEQLTTLGVPRCVSGISLQVFQDRGTAREHDCGS